MLKDNDFISPGLTNKNLDALSLNISLLSQRRIVELSLLARQAAEAFSSLYNEGLNVYEIREALFETEDKKIYPGEEGDSFSKKAVSYIKASEALDKAVFVQALVAELSSNGLSLCEADYLDEGAGEETFVYVKNRLADEAFDVFSENFKDPRVFYAPDFRSAARAVLADKCEYCLLPLEERGGVRISSVGALLYSLDLKINSVSSVFGPDGTQDMRYALISKHFSIPPAGPDDDRYLEVRLSGISSELLSCIFLVAQHFGLSVYRINTNEGSGEDAEGSVTVVFSVLGGTFVELLTYLSIFCPSHTVVGIYANLE